MKKLTFIFTLVLSLNILFAQQDIDRYMVKSGHIEYELTGSTKGTKKIWWDDYGDKERVETKSNSEVKIFGMVQTEEEHSVHITNGNKFWHVNLIDNTGVKGTEEYYEPVDFIEDMTEAEKKQFEEDLLNAFGGERLPPEEVLGYTCEVIEVMGAKTWIYKGVALKSTAKIMGVVVNETATKFDTEIKITESKFKPPTDIEFVEGSYE